MVVVTPEDNSTGLLVTVVVAVEVPPPLDESLPVDEITSGDSVL